MCQVSISELHDSSDVLARMSRCERLTLTHDGLPVATLVPLPRRSLPVEELIRRRAHLPRIDAVGLAVDNDRVVDSSPWVVS